MKTIMGVTKAPHCYLSTSATWQSFLGSDLGIVLVENKHSALLFSDSSIFSSSNGTCEGTLYIRGLDQTCHPLLLVPVVTNSWHVRGRLGNKAECVNCAM